MLVLQRLIVAIRSLTWRHLLDVFAKKSRLRGNAEYRVHGNFYYTRSNRGVCQTNCVTEVIAAPPTARALRQTSSGERPGHPHFSSYATHQFPTPFPIHEVRGRSEQPDSIARASSSLSGNKDKDTHFFIAPLDWAPAI